MRLVKYCTTSEIFMAALITNDYLDGGMSLSGVAL
jgi:hypothetical protein